MSYSIVNGTVDDWKEACDVTAKLLNWNRSYRDFETYVKAYGTDNVTFLVAKDEEQNYIGCGMLAKAKCGISTITMYFVLPEHRGKGIGSKIFTKLTQESIAEGRNIGLNAAANMSKKFDVNLGFNKYPNWKIEVIGFKEIQADYVHQHFDAANDCKIGSVSNVNLSQLIAFDTKITGGLDRSEFVKAWTSHPDGCAKVAYNSKTGEIMGYAMGRLVTNDKVLMCPLYAQDDATAEQLILAIFHQDKNITSRSGSFFAITATVDRLIAILNKFARVTRIAHIINQFTREIPATDCDKVYGISDIALGFI